MNEQLSLSVDDANSRLSRFPPLSNLNAAFMTIVKSEDLTSKIPTSHISQITKKKATMTELSSCVTRGRKFPAKKFPSKNSDSSLCPRCLRSGIPKFLMCHDTDTLVIRTSGGPFWWHSWLGIWIFWLSRITEDGFLLPSVYLSFNFPKYRMGTRRAPELL